MKYILIILSISIGFCTQAQVGSNFPTLDGESLVHGDVKLPDDVQGKYTLVGLAFSKKAEKYLNGWFDPVYKQLIEEPDESSLFAFSYDVNVYFIPMLTGAKRPAYQSVMKKVEAEVDPKLHPHVLFYQGTMKEYKDALNIDSKDVPYFYLLDPEGKIVYAASGPYKPFKLQKIVDELPFDE